LENNDVRDVFVVSYGRQDSHKEDTTVCR